MISANRESSFLHAIWSSSVVYQIMKACSEGQIPNCDCDNKKIRGEIDRTEKEDYVLNNPLNSIDLLNKKLAWNGCSVDYDHADKLGEQLIDSADTRFHSNSRSIKSLVNLHNSRVGRRVLKQHLKLECACYGLSASCVIKFCKLTLPPFKAIGNELKKKYQNAVLVNSKAVFNTNEIKNQLVYMTKSPDFCVRNLNKGILGTKGRECKLNSSELINNGKSCEVLCCGQGYVSVTTKAFDACNCNFDEKIMSIKCHRCYIDKQINSCK